MDTRGPMTIRLRAWLAIGLTAIGLYLVGRWQGAASVADAAAVQNAQTALALGPTYRARLDSLRHREHQQIALTGTWRSRADSLRAMATRRDTVAVANPSDSATIGLWQATANAERESGNRCQVALATCQGRAQTAEARAQALDSLLGNVLKVKSCRFLLFNCPSRTAIGLLGLGLGFAGGLLVR